MSDKEDQFLSINLATTAEFKDRGSRFIAYLAVCKTMEDFEHNLDLVKKEHNKARHHCYSYRMNYEDELWRMNDDGEPSGTAGKPIYGQLVKNNLYDVSCIVVRYFGGTKLGTSGLINAYKTSTALAIDASAIVTKYVTQSIQFDFGYDKMGQIMDLLKSMDVEITGKNFTTTPNVIIQTPKSKATEFIRLLKAKLLKVDLEYVDKKTEVPFCKFTFLS